jgi:hypothetical protein
VQLNKGVGISKFLQNFAHRIYKYFMQITLKDCASNYHSTLDIMKLWLIFVKIIHKLGLWVCTASESKDTRTAEID